MIDQAAHGHEPIGLVAISFNRDRFESARDRGAQLRGLRGLRIMNQDQSVIVAGRLRVEPRDRQSAGVVAAPIAPGGVAFIEGQAGENAQIGMFGEQPPPGARSARRGQGNDRDLRPVRGGGSDGAISRRAGEERRQTAVIIARDVPQIAAAFAAGHGNLEPAFLHRESADHLPPQPHHQAGGNASLRPRQQVAHHIGLASGADEDGLPALDAAHLMHDAGAGADQIMHPVVDFIDPGAEAAEGGRCGHRRNIIIGLYDSF